MRLVKNRKFLNESMNSSVASSGIYDTDSTFTPISTILAGFICEDSYISELKHDKILNKAVK